MAQAGVSLPKLVIGEVTFPPAAAPPGSSSSLFLAGAGERGLEIDRQFVVFTAIGVYLEDLAVSTLAPKWKGKTADDLAGNSDFFRDIFTGPFEKFTRITMVKPLSGQQYSEKVEENCVAHWKAAGTYTEAEAAAVEKFKEACKNETFPPGTSILFTHQVSPASLTITFWREGSMPETGNTVIESKALSEAILESIIGKHGVSPGAKRSVAQRLSEILEEVKLEGSK
nr:chalcone isomerase [Canna x generalis]